MNEIVRKLNIHYMYTCTRLVQRNVENEVLSFMQNIVETRHIVDIQMFCFPIVFVNCRMIHVSLFLKSLDKSLYEMTTYARSKISFTENRT